MTSQPPAGDPAGRGPGTGGRPPGPAAGLTAGLARSPAVLALGGLNVLVFLWVEAQGGATRTTLVESGALVVPLIPDEPWRLLTNTFLHFGLFHLLANMLGLAIFGPPFEQLVGRARFVALWIVAGLAGSAATVLTASGITIAAGASGSVFGLLGAFTIVAWRTRDTPAGAIRLRQALVLLGINLALGLTSPEIGVEAHLGGALAGMLVLTAYAGRRPRAGDPPRTPNPARGLPVAIAVGVISVVVALAA